MIPSFLVENFRAFERLEIPRLARVNLITGRNNVGKTSLLEALRVHGLCGRPDELLDLLVRHDELHLHGPGGAAAGLFRDPLAPATFRVADGAHALEVRRGFRPALAAEGEEPPVSWSPLPSAAPVLVVSWDNQRVVVSANPADLRGYRDRIWPSWWPCRTAGAMWHRAGPERLWDATAGRPAEDEVVAALQLLVPGIERLYLIQHGSGFFDDAPEWRVRVAGSKVPVPLHRYGDGLKHLLGLAIAAVNCRGGTLLVDEVENGLHHSVLEGVWRFVFDVAARFDVQVFATTHSKDCVHAFAAAAGESPEDGQAILLVRVDDAVEARVFREEDLSVIVDQDLEVRS